MVPESPDPELQGCHNVYGCKCVLLALLALTCTVCLTVYAQVCLDVCVCVLAAGTSLPALACVSHSVCVIGSEVMLGEVWLGEERVTAASVLPGPEPFCSLLPSLILH